MHSSLKTLLWRKFLLLGLIVLMPACIQQQVSYSTGAGSSRGTSAYIDLTSNFVEAGSSIAGILYPSRNNTTNSLGLDATDVSFAIVGGTAQANISNIVENSDGTLSFNVNATAAGSNIQIRALISGFSTGVFSEELQVTPGGYDTNTADVNIITAGPFTAGDEIEVSIDTLLGASGAGLNVACGLFRDTTRLSRTFASDEGDGTYTALFTLRAAVSGAENGLIACTINGNTIADTDSIVVSAGPPAAMSAISNTIRGQTVSATIDGTDPNNPQPSIRLTDAYGNLLSGEAIDWEMSNGSVDTITPGGGATTDANGVATLGLITFDDRMESVTLTAYSNTRREVNVSFNFDLVADTPTRIDMVGGNGQQAEILDPFTQTLEVLLLDDAGNRIPNITVCWATAAGSVAGVLNNEESKTDDQGIARNSVTAADEVGTLQIEAWFVAAELTEPDCAAGSAGGVIETFTLAVSEGAPFEILVKEGAFQTGRANENVGGVPTFLPDDIVIQVLDDRKNKLDEVGLTWTVVEGGGTINTDPDGGNDFEGLTTDADGLATVEYALGLKKGRQVIRVTANGNNNVTADIEFTAFVGDPDTISIESGNNQSVMIEDQALDFKVKIVDEYGAPLEQQGVLWTVTAGHDVQISSGATATDADGIASVGVTLGSTPGQYTVSAVAFSPTITTPANATQVFNITSRYHSLANSYISKVNDDLVSRFGAGNELSASDQRLIHDFIKGLDDLQMLGNLHDLWLFRDRMNSSYTTGDNNIISLRNNNTSSRDGRDVDGNDNGVVPTANGVQLNGSDYLRTSGTKINPPSNQLGYNQRTLLISFNRTGGREDALLQTSNDGNFTGNNSKGFYMGTDAIIWGYDDQFGNVSRANVNTGTEVMMATAIRGSGAIYSYVNGGQEIPGTTTSWVKDNDLMHIGLDSGQANGFLGTISMVADFRIGLSAQQILDFYELYKNTMGTGLGLP